MKLNRMIAIGALALAFVLSIPDAFGQINNGGGGNGGGFGNGGGGGGFGGGRRNRGNGGNFDPAQMQQRQLDRIRQQLDFTNDTDWSAVEPLVQKVLDAQQAARMGGGGRGGFGGNRRGGNGGPNGNNFNGNNGGGRGGFGPQPSPEAEALQQAVDNDAPADQIKDLLAKYNAAQKSKQSALDAARANLRQVLTVKQEAQATLMGLL